MSARVNVIFGEGTLFNCLYSQTREMMMMKFVGKGQPRLQGAFQGAFQGAPGKSALGSSVVNRGTGYITIIP